MRIFSSYFYNRPIKYPTEIKKTLMTAISRMNLSMNQRILLPICFLFICLTLSPAFGTIIYQVSPIAINNGYAVAGGTITTDGTIGFLTASSILEYEIHVTGPVPHTFSSSKVGSAVSVLTPDPSFPFRDGVSVSATEISLAVPTRQGNLSRISFFEDSTVETDIRVEVRQASLVWSQITSGDETNNGSNLTYEIELLIDEEAGFQEFEERANLNSQIAFDPFVIARAVPEPTTAIFCSMAMLIFSTTRRKCNLCSASSR